MLISDYIAQIIEEMLEDGGGKTEVRRNDLASKLGCVPSQINYVITSRYTPEKVYIIESRRGGGGYIRIVRAQMTKHEYLMHVFHSIGEELDERSAAAFAENLRDRGFLTERELLLVKSTLSPAALEHIPAENKNYVRADIMRHIIMTIMG